ncbi:MAG TPA: chromosome partitioning protein ParB [Burkholderiaceae bacterium]|nr:chromosome partitioning protein ParB [Burkholderiaceae bacterium]
MSGPHDRRQRPVIGPRPAPTAATAWVRRGDGEVPAYSARLTIDVTPALRGRIKVVAFQRGMTAAAMLRALLEREFPENTP